MVSEDTEVSCLSPAPPPLQDQQPGRGLRVQPAPSTVGLAMDGDFVAENAISMSVSNHGAFPSLGQHFKNSPEYEL